MNTMLKIGTVLFWCLAVYLQWVSHEGLLAWVPQLVLIILAVHVIEIAVFWLLLRAKSRRPLLDAGQILVFGIFHMQKFIGQGGRVERLS